MTSEDNADQTHGLRDERAVDVLLAEAGFTDDPHLRQVLLQLRELRVSDVPEPSAELAALLAESRTANVLPFEPGTPRRKKRVVLTTLAVAASFGVAGGAAATNEDLRRGAEGGISAVVEWFSPAVPAAPAAPAPAVPSRAPSPGPAVGSVPAVDVPAADPPREPLPSTPPAPDTTSETPAAESLEGRRIPSEAPRASSGGTTETPRDDAGQSGRGGADAAGGGGAAPPEADRAPVPDVSQGRPDGRRTTDQQDLPVPLPAPKGKPGTAR
jgi:hypothetical protein